MTPVEISYEDEDGAREVFERWECPKCGGSGATFHGFAERPHFARIECGDCGAWLAWMPKPRSKAEQKARRRSRRSALDPDACCWWCGRTQDELSVLGLRLEAAHPIEVADAIDADQPEPTLVMPLCSECHPQQHRRREEVARYLKALYSAGVLAS